MTGLERFAAQLEQADVVLASSGDIGRRLAAVRALLRGPHAEDMPTRDARALWIEIAATMLRVGRGPATGSDIEGLSLQIRQLRKAILDHLGVVVL